MIAVAIALAFGVVAEPVVPTRNESAVKVEVIFHDEPRSAVRTCHALGAWPGLTLEQVLRREAGCAAYYRDTNTCIVHVPRPVNVDDNATTILGHEVLHCFRGRYHQ